MAASDFSWLKIASFFGAAILVFLCFVVIASGILLVKLGHGFNGGCTIVGGLLCGAAAVLVYLNYEKQSKEKK